MGVHNKKLCSKVLDEKWGPGIVPIVNLCGNCTEPMWSSVFLDRNNLYSLRELQGLYILIQVTWLCQPTLVDTSLPLQDSLSLHHNFPWIIILKICQTKTKKLEELISYTFSIDYNHLQYLLLKWIHHYQYFLQCAIVCIRFDIQGFNMTWRAAATPSILSCWRLHLTRYLDKYIVHCTLLITIFYSIPIDCITSVYQR